MLMLLDRLVLRLDLIALESVLREAGVSLLQEFRVYNSGKIPALMEATHSSAPKPQLHGLAPVLQAA